MEVYSSALHAAAANAHAPYLRLSKQRTPRKKVAVIISGTGTNLQALIDATNQVCRAPPSLCCACG